MIWEIKFFTDPGWTDITSLIDERTIKMRRALTNEARTSIVDSYSFTIRWDATISDKFAAATQRVFFKATDDENSDEAIFTGWIAPTLSEVTRAFPDRLSLEALDMSYLLDEVATPLEMPTTIGGTAPEILDTANPTNSIVGAILDAAGYDTSTILSGTCPDITATVEHFIIREEDGRTWRDILDTLLGEYLHTFTFNAAGRFTVARWAPATVTPAATISNWGIRDGLKRIKRDTDYDGARVTWAKLKSLSSVRLYSGNLPIGVKDDGFFGFTGEDIPAGDYWPPDSDVVDIYQEYTTEWLDTPYQNRGNPGGSRVQNPDISLITSKDHVLDYSAHADFVIDLETYGTHRAQVRLRNSGGGSRLLYSADIVGTALFRNEIRKVTSPAATKRPREITTEFIFDVASAIDLASAWDLIYQNGDFLYDFAAVEWYEPGTILRIYPDHADAPNIDSNVIVLSAEWSGDSGFARHGQTFVRYRCQGLTAFAQQSVGQTGTISTVPPVQDDLMDALLEERPSWPELGFDSGRTQSPVTVTDLAASASFQDIVVSWSMQPDLTNLSHYEIQAALSAEANPAARYAPVSGEFWTGAAGQAVEVYGTAYTHQAIANAAGPPIAGRTVYYYVRAVTRSGEYGAWSGPVSATTYPLVEEDLVSGDLAFGGVAIAELSDITGDLGAIVAGSLTQDATLNFYDIDSGEMRIGDANSWLAFRDPGTGYRAELVNADLELTSAGLVTKETYLGEVFGLEQAALTLRWENETLSRVLAAWDYDYINSRVDFAAWDGASLVDVFHIDADGIDFEGGKGLYYGKGGAAEERVRFFKQRSDFSTYPTGLPDYRILEIGGDGLIAFTDTDANAIRGAIDVNTGFLFLQSGVYLNSVNPLGSGGAVDIRDSTGQSRVYVNDSGVAIGGAIADEWGLAIRGPDGVSANSTLFRLITKQSGTGDFQTIAAIGPTGSSSNDGYMVLYSNGVVKCRIAADPSRAGENLFTGMTRFFASGAGWTDNVQILSSVGSGWNVLADSGVSNSLRFQATGDSAEALRLELGGTMWSQSGRRTTATSVSTSNNPLSQLHTVMRNTISNNKTVVASGAIQYTTLSSIFVVSHIQRIDETIRIHYCGSGGQAGYIDITASTTQPAEWSVSI